MLSDLSFQQHAVAERARRLEGEAAVRRQRRAAAGSPRWRRSWARRGPEVAPPPSSPAIGASR